MCCELCFLYAVFCQCFDLNTRISMALPYNCIIMIQKFPTIFDINRYDCLECRDHFTVMGRHSLIQLASAHICTTVSGVISPPFHACSLPLSVTHSLAPFFVCPCVRVKHWRTHKCKLWPSTIGASANAGVCVRVCRHAELSIPKLVRAMLPVRTPTQ